MMLHFCSLESFMVDIFELKCKWKIGIRRACSDENHFAAFHQKLTILCDEY